MTHICVGNQPIIGSDNDLLPGQCKASIWTSARILSIEPLGIDFSEISIANDTFLFKKMHLEMSSGKWVPFGLGLNVLRYIQALSTVRLTQMCTSWWHFIHQYIIFVCLQVMNNCYWTLSCTCRAVFIYQFWVGHFCICVCSVHIPVEVYSLH